jgi:hypothetical protein
MNWLDADAFGSDPARGETNNLKANPMRIKASKQK